MDPARLTRLIDRVAESASAQPGAVGVGAASMGGEE